jgi:NAD(P)-dependent dehydrogenase (short-subunit alcohol dehydrogenase family)
MELLVKEDSFRPNARIVCISSDRARDPNPGSMLYSAAKSALESLTRSWAIELPLKYPGTTVNTVCVGLTDTPLFRGYPVEVQEKTKQERTPRVKVVEGGRMGTAEDVADVVGWLVSEKSRWVTGSVVPANGGAVFLG